MKPNNNFILSIKTGSAWLYTNIIFVIAPTALAYLYEMISQEEFPDLMNYYDSIILIVFSVSCNLFAVCSDNRSNSIKKIFVEFIKKTSRLSAIIYGGFHFYIVGTNKYTVNEHFLTISLIILVLFSILGCIFAIHHTIYNVFIVYIQNKITNENIKIKNKEKGKYKKIWKHHHQKNI